jgi:hypothetical protein
MKAVAWPMIISIVVGVLVLFVALNFINPTWIEAMGFDPLGNKAKLRSIELGDQLETAVKCAYDRCFKGCNSPDVAGLKWGNYECRRDFCDKKFQNSEGKICNEMQPTGLNGPLSSYQDESS